MNSVHKLLIDCGGACVKCHDENGRDVNAAVINCDRIWSFTYAKQEDAKTAKAVVEYAVALHFMY